MHIKLIFTLKNNNAYFSEETKPYECILVKVHSVKKQWYLNKALHPYLLRIY